MRHELDPVRGDHIEERRLPVGAVGVARRRAVPLVAVRRCSVWSRVNSLRLITCGSGFSSGCARHGGSWASSLRPRSGKVASNCTLRANNMPGRSHRGILDVVADAGQRCGSGSARPCSAGRRRRRRSCEVRMARLEPHLLPRFSTGRRLPSTRPCTYSSIGLVVEQIELDQLHALVFEIDQRAVDAARVAVEQMAQQRQPRPSACRSATRVARAPVVRPVDPGHAAPRDRALAAAAARDRLVDLAVETLDARSRRAGAGRRAPT